MKTVKEIRALIITLAICLIATNTFSANDYPHFGKNNVGCDSCHFIFGSEPSALPPWTNYEQLNIDDTQHNRLCQSCHTDTEAPYVKTHSSLVMEDESYGEWSVECRVCHNIHYQKQLITYGSESYIYSGASTGVTSSTITKTGAGWTVNAYQGFVVVPNVSQKNYNYEILSNTSDTITVQGPITLTKVSVGDTFAIVYGNLINDRINLSKITITPSKSGSKTVRFFRKTGSKSFADGDETYDGICEVCHTQTTHFRNDGTGPDQLHTNMGSIPGTKCTTCHQHSSGFKGMGGGAHTTHVLEGCGPELSCFECHAENIPDLIDAQDLENTTICNSCHSTAGAATAKTYWGKDGSSRGGAGSWAAVTSEISYCGSCHDSTPGNTKKDGTGDTAPDVMGNGTTYGYAVTGHGKTSGNYTRLSWQDTTATGNPAGNRQCSACHDLSTAHFNNVTNRLKSGYENDANNSNCKQCHNPGSVAVADPQWYTTYADYQNSAHSSKKCSDCHDVHGASGVNIGMTKLNQEALCNQGSCHSGIGSHPGVGTASFNHTSKTYTLECISCHNVHLVTGTSAQAASNKSPVTKFSENTHVWGDDWNEKMDFYAGGGTYRTPNGETFTGAQLPDYASFCQDCHGQSGSAPFGISWSSDPHGTQSANQPNGYGTCPNWFACGKAFGWDGDDCVGTQAQCWPVTPRGDGDQIYSREPFTHTERVAGANFTLSCTNCHTGHGTGTLPKASVNGGGPLNGGNWNTTCNYCHYYYSDWHAGMSCGSASCHVTNSPHRASNMSGSGGTRTHTQGLVLDYRFENNLNDSGGWQMDGKWYSTAGSYAAGKSGQAAVLDENINIQIGTENANWANDEGYHGTWKYTMMKYNTTLEAWVYPTNNTKTEQYIVFPHNGNSNGDYLFSLRKINGTLRASFSMQSDNNSFTQGGMSGLRGAYSSVGIPLNTWTHVAVTFDTSGADRNPSVPSIGRIRFYVNGEDVTTSDSSGNYMQPGANETSIFARAENSPWNQGICYNGTWCASDWSVGGFDWNDNYNYTGRIDDIKIWNITKDASYFSAYDSQAGPYIAEVNGMIGNNQLTVKFSEGVYTSTGSSGALVAGDFALTDTDNSRTISNVSHTAGSSTATLTLSSALDGTNDVNTDTLAATNNNIFDNYNLAAGTAAVTIIPPVLACPTSLVTINLNEASGSTYIYDTQSALFGTVYGGASTLTGSAYSGGGTGSGRYIMFDYNTSCLTASTAMTIEARIKPTGTAGTGSYVTRILARDGAGNYQLSLWRNNSAANIGISGSPAGSFNAPSGEVAVALWINPVNLNGGSSWKPVLTNYTNAKTGSENNCPIVSDRWYKIRAVWDTNKPGGTPGQPFTPADIYVDDQGVNGDDVGEGWAGYINCTDSDQSLKASAVKFYTGDTINAVTGENFAIGANRSNPANNLFNGLIDWITWKDSL